MPFKTDFVVALKSKARAIVPKSYPHRARAGHFLSNFPTSQLDASEKSRFFHLLSGFVPPYRTNHQVKSIYKTWENDDPLKRTTCVDFSPKWRCNSSTRTRTHDRDKYSSLAAAGPCGARACDVRRLILENALVERRNRTRKERGHVVGCPEIFKNL